MGSPFTKTKEELEAEKLAMDKSGDDAKNTEAQTSRVAKAPCKVRSLMQISLPDQLLKSGEIFEVAKQATLDELLALKAVEVVK